MAFQLHRVMEDTTDLDDAAVTDAKDYQMPGATNWPRLFACPTAAQAKMPAPGAYTQFGANGRARTLGILRDVTNRRDDQRLITDARSFSEALFGSSKNIDNVRLSRGGQSVSPHSAARTQAIGGMFAKTGYEIGEFVIRNVGETPGMDIIPTKLGRFSEPLDAHGILGGMLFDQTQTVTQHFAGVLVATGPDKSVDELGLMVGQNYIARGHGLISKIEILLSWLA